MTDDELQLENEQNLVAFGSKSKEELEKERLQAAGVLPVDSIDQSAPAQFNPAYGG